MISRLYKLLKFNKYFNFRHYGRLAGRVLVGNYSGKRKIAAFYPTTGIFSDYMRDVAADPIEILVLWGLIFGNAASLGNSNACAAGPGDETNGLFGSLRTVQ